MRKILRRKRIIIINNFKMSNSKCKLKLTKAEGRNTNKRTRRRIRQPHTTKPSANQSSGKFPQAK